MRLSHDETFLVTVGADGNIFVFSLVPLHQLRDAVRDRQAKIPVGVGESGYFIVVFSVCVFVCGCGCL